MFRFNGFQEDANISCVRKSMRALMFWAGWPQSQFCGSSCWAQQIEGRPRTSLPCHSVAFSATWFFSGGYWMRSSCMHVHCAVNWYTKWFSTIHYWLLFLSLGNAWGRVFYSYEYIFVMKWESSRFVIDLDRLTLKRKLELPFV